MALLNYQCFSNNFKRCVINVMFLVIGSVHNLHGLIGYCCIPIIVGSGGEDEVWKWCNLLISWFHALIVGSRDLLYFYYYPELLDDLINFRNTFCYNLIVFSTDFEDTFEDVDSGASLTIHQQMSAFRKGHYIMIKDRPCRIIDMNTCGTCKHGSVKVHVTAIDVFNDQKCDDDVSPSTANGDIPIDISSDEYVRLMSQLCSWAQQEGRGPDPAPAPQYRERPAGRSRRTYCFLFVCIS